MMLEGLPTSEEIKKESERKKVQWSARKSPHKAASYRMRPTATGELLV